MSKLLFVYNANSGIDNMVLDVVLKLFRPETYACNLCAITYNTFSENKKWKAFRQQNIVEMDFLHTDEFEAKYKDSLFTYPIILKEDNNTLQPFLKTNTINKLKTVDDLINAIKKHNSLQ